MPPGPLSRILRRFPEESRRPYAAQIAVVFAMITLLNLGYYREHALQQIATEHGQPTVIRGWDGLAWFVWLAAAPAMLFLVRKYPLSGPRIGGNLLRHLGGHAAVYLLLTNARYLLRMLSDSWLHGDGRLLFNWQTYSTTQVMRLPLDFLTYAGFLAAAFAIDYYHKDRRRAEEVQQLQLHAAWLQSELSQAQLVALRGQVHPHFLFNAFNAISTLVRQQRNEAAVGMIAQLSSLLRMSMETIEEPELPLGRELNFVRSYLEIERIRFGDRLTVEAVVEPGALECLVPNLLLQPVVENAIKHGVAQRVDEGRVELRASRRGDRLELEVADNGPGMDAPAVRDRPGGIGLANVRRRLHRMYGEDYRLDIGPRPGGGTAVRLDLPWRVVAAPQAFA